MFLSIIGVDHENVVNDASLGNDVNEVMSDQIKLINDEIDANTYIFSSDKPQAKYNAVQNLKRKYSKSVAKDILVLNNYIENLRRLGLSLSALLDTRKIRLQSIRESFNKKIQCMFSFLEDHKTKFLDNQI